MNVAQVWSIVAIMAAGLGTMITLTFRYVGARFETVDARFETVDARFDRLEAKFDAKFDAMNARFDHLDRDLQRVIERIFPIS